MTTDQHDYDRLDDLWDTVARGERVRPVDPRERVQTETIRGVHGADATPRPDPRFLRDLRRTLMETSLDAASRGGPFPNRPSTPEWTSIRRRRPAAIGRPSVLRRIIGVSTRPFEIAAVVALVLATLVFAAGDRDRDYGLHGLPGFRQVDPSGTAMYLGDAARTGEMPGPGPQGEIGLRWRVPDGARDWELDSSPVAVDGVVYVATRAFHRQTGVVETGMAALDLATGHELWEVPLDGFLSDGSETGPVVAGGLVYVGISKEYWLGGPPATPEVGATPVGVAHMAGALVALDAKTGVQVWSYETARAGNFAPVVADGTAYVLSEDGTLHAVDAATGEPRWTASVSSDTTRGLASSPAVADGTVYVASNLGRLHAFDAATGSERWSAVIGGNQPTIPVVAGGTVFVGDYAGAPFDPGDPADPVLPEGTQRLYALDAATGSARWSLDLEMPEQVALHSAPTVAGETVLLTGLGPNGNQIVALSAADGRERWRAAAEGGFAVPATWSGDTVYVGSFDSNLYALDLASGAVRWKVATAGPVMTAAFVVDGIVVFGSGVGDGNLYAVGSVEPGLGTPAATSAPGGDVSGLPRCDVEPRPALQRGSTGRYVVPVAGTPAASLMPVHDPSAGGSTANVRWSEVPTGEPAPAEATDAIRATIAAMTNCARPGFENQLAAYYSDDYFRRPPVAQSLPYNGYHYVGVPGADIGDFESAVVLPDGRVATVFRYTVSSHDGGTADYGSLVVWVEKDGRWLVDETAEISESPAAG